MLYIIIKWLGGVINKHLIINVMHPFVLIRTKKRDGRRKRGGDGKKQREREWEGAKE